MANQKISQLSTLTGASGNDIIVIVSNGTTYNIPVSGITTVFRNSAAEGYIPVFSGGVYTDSIIYQNQDGVLIGSNIEDTLSNPDMFGVYAGETDSYNLISAHGTIDNYLQLNIRNISDGGDASSDIVATKNDGDETTGYINMGINSSNYSATTYVGGANDAYLYSTGNDLYIGNATANGEIIFFSGGLDALNRAKVFFHNTGTVGINTNTNDDQNPAGLRVFAPSSASYNLIYGRGEIDNYSQFNIQNVNGGLSASTDIVATNDIGNETSYYVNVGINSSNHQLHPTVGPGQANDTYFLSVNSGGNTYFGSGTGGDLIFHSGNNFDGDTHAKLILTANSGHSINGNVVMSSGLTLTSVVGLNYVNDSAAANAGIPIGGVYHTSGTLKIRIV